MPKTIVIKGWIEKKKTSLEVLCVCVRERVAVVVVVGRYFLILSTILKNGQILLSHPVSYYNSTKFILQHATLEGSGGIFFFFLILILYFNLQKYLLYVLLFYSKFKLHVLFA